ncbi:MAG: ABC transporter permease [Ignavibacteriae bacterium]|nr:ABC transporter permease [Ignavibacteriota bacterium]
MKIIFNLLLKDYIRYFNDKPAILITFAVPIVLIIIFGSIYGGGGSPRGKVKIIFVNESNNEISKIIEAKLDSSSMIQLVKKYTPENEKTPTFIDEEKAKQFVREGKRSAALILPNDFFADTSSSLKFKFFYDPKNEIESQIIQASIQQTIMMQISDLLPVLMQRKARDLLGGEEAEKFKNKLGSVIGEYFDVSADTIVDAMTNFKPGSSSGFSSSDSNETNILSDIIKFESEQLVGMEISNPGVTRIVGGWAMMFLLFTLTATATSLFEEKQEGSLKRLMCMPVKRSHILWSKYIFSISLGVVQLFTMFIFAWLFYDVDIFSNFLNLLIVVIASASAAVAFGMIITSFAKSINQASGIATLIILVMSALGGSWFPIVFFPEWIQVIAKGTITYWSVEAFLQVLWRQADFSAIALHVLILFSTAFIVNFYSLIRFKSGKIF